MALIDDLYPWLVFLHVFGVFVFLLAHGVSAGVSFRLRKERNPERLRALLDLSRSSYTVVIIGFLWILATGSILGVLGGWWRQAWFWVALVALFAITGAMTPLVATKYNKVRRALGFQVPYQSRRDRSAPPPAEAEIDTILSRARPIAVAAIGMGGIAIILWLMMFKPF